MTTAAGLPSRYQAQGPATSCVIHGRALGWLSCTCYAFAMATDQGSVNRVRLTGCDFRDATNDTVGGTTLAQNAPLAESNGVSVAVYTGSNVVSPYWTAVQAQAGRGFVLQGNTAALLSTSFRATGGAVNHAVFVSKVRGGKLGEPQEALVYDPAADGRKRAYHVDQGPSWWPWALVLRFAAALRPWGDTDPRLLGPGKFYCAVFPDTDPHAHLRYGGKKSSPFPDRTRSEANGVRVHSMPKKGIGNVVRTLDKGDLFIAYQYAKGDIYQGSTRWLGSHDGREWVHEKRLTHVGGGT